MTTPGAGGQSPLRLAGLALIGVAVVAAIIGLASMATNGDPTPTAAPSPAPSPTAPPALAPPPMPPPAPLPTDDGGVPIPSFEGTAPGEAPPGAPAPGAPAPGDPGAPAPAPGAPAPVPGDPGAPAPAPGAPAPAPGGTAPDAPAPGGSVPDAQPPAPQGQPYAAPPPAARSGGGGTGDASGGAAKGTVTAPLRVYNNSTISGLAARAAEDFRRAGWPIDEIGNYPHGIIPTTTVYYRPGTDEEVPAKALADQFGMRANERFPGLESATPGIIVIVTNDYGR